MVASGEIDGVMAMGGLQNTTIGAAAMRGLPWGLPKLLVSTVASGQRTFEPLVGIGDVTVMPAVADLSGLSRLSRTILDNAVAAMGGMMAQGGGIMAPSAALAVGVTLMGATDRGVSRAAAILAEAGLEVVSFHATGAGGRAMEAMVEASMLGAVMDLTLHELVYETLGGGFGFSNHQRLTGGAKRIIPRVVAPGGLDFVCLWRHELTGRWLGRKMIWHNRELAHVKLNAEEALAATDLAIERLNRSQGPISVVFPLRGLRSHTRAGEPLCDPALDLAILERLTSRLGNGAAVKTVDANLHDEAFSALAAGEMMRLAGLG
jgi:uncharacterized protein (UPF0261 family)